jgi:hypothetical protein
MQISESCAKPPLSPNYLPAEEAKAEETVLQASIWLSLLAETQACVLMPC